VSIDGRPVQALKAGALRAVQVPAGARRVTWTFFPPGVRGGWIISLIAAVSTLSLAFSPWLNRYTPRGHALRRGARPNG
jgi:uncharacterized membrane protein YfhO